MKLFGTKSNSKHNHSTGKSSGGKHSAPSANNKIIRVVVIVLAVILAIAIAVFAYWKTSVKPPDVPQPPVNNNTGDTTDPNQDKTPDNTGSGTTNPGNTDVNPPENTDPPPEHVVTRYTFLVAGMDDGNGNTDTLMVATFDISDYSLNIVSIPRDTLVNVSWSVKKVNTLYGGSKIDRLKEGISDLLGFDISFYAIVDLDAFEKLIDAIGGVDYYVPVNMEYNDPAQDLFIDIKKGQQLVDGENAMKIMRFRAGYADADIGRIETQQDFLKTAASQILSNVTDVPITTLADIIINDVKTDLTHGNIIWFAKELLKMDAENIKFHTLPADYEDYFWQGGKWVSYCTIYVDEWLAFINEHLNPFADPIEKSNLNIATRDENGDLYATSGELNFKSSWGKKPANYTPPSTSTPVTGETTGGTDTTDTPADTPTDTPVDAPVTEPEPGEGSTEAPSTETPGTSEGEGTVSDTPTDTPADTGAET